MNGVDMSFKNNIVGYLNSGNAMEISNVCNVTIEVANQSINNYKEAQVASMEKMKLGQNPSAENSTMRKIVDELLETAGTSGPNKTY